MNVKGIGTQNIINFYTKNSNRIDTSNSIKKVSDSIQISELGKSLNDYTIDGYNINNSEKIERIRQQIQSGTYNVDAKLTAQSMINFMKENNI